MRASKKPAVMKRIAAYIAWGRLLTAIFENRKLEPHTRYTVARHSTSFAEWRGSTRKFTPYGAACSYHIAHELLQRAADGQQDRSYADRKVDDVHVLARHGRHIVRVEIPGDQARHQISQGRGQEPHSHHLAHEAFGGKLGEVAQAHGTQAQLAEGVQQVRQYQPVRQDRK